MKRTIVWIVSLLIVSILSVFYNNYKRLNRLEKSIRSSYSWENPEANSYMEDFLREFQIKDDFKQKKIKFIEKFPEQFDPRQIILDIEDDLELNDLVGISYGMYRDSIIDIYIDNSFWKTSKKSIRKRLIFHELGHDILNLNHSEDPDDFMFPYIIR